MWMLAGKLVFFVGFAAVFGMAVFHDDLKSVASARKDHIIQIQAASLQAAKAQISVLRHIIHHKDQANTYLRAELEAIRPHRFALLAP